MRLLLLPLLFLLVSCGRSGIKEPEGYQVSAEVLSRYATLKVESRDVMDQHGFVEAEKCDSILMSGLTAVGRGERIDLYSARGYNGQWYRRPLTYPECFSSGGSKSSISRDMFVGIIWYLWRTQDLDGLKAIHQYGEEHDWIMGEGVISRTAFGFGLQSTLGAAIRKLEGKSLGGIVEISDPWLPGATDFEAHLQVLHILLRGEIYGSLSDSAINRLKQQSSRQPKNPLFQYARARWVDGDYSSAEQALLQGPWPGDRLGTELDYCTPWVIERDYGPNWFPCEQVSENKRHSSGDWLFVAGLLLEAAGNKPVVLPL